VSRTLKITSHYSESRFACGKPDLKSNSAAMTDTQRNRKREESEKEEKGSELVVGAAGQLIVGVSFVRLPLYHEFGFASVS
jgi:hypothetical protein